MSYRDVIKSRSVGGVPLVGSFRAAKFIVPDSSAAFGRRKALHEYPLRDKPYVEDLGKKARQFSVDVFVDERLGDYLQARDALIEAIEKEGPGTLVHPWYGTMTVSLLEPAAVTESTRAGGRASFRLVFVEDGGLRFPSAAGDSQQDVEDKADAGLTSALDDFLEIFDTDGLPAWSLTEIEDSVTDTFAGIEAMASGVTGTVSSEIRSPANMGAAIIGGVQRIATIAEEPGEALQLYKRLLRDEPSCDCPTNTTVRKQQANSMAAMQRLTRQATVIEAARSASQAEYSTGAEALATSALLLDQLDELMEAVDPVNGEPIADDLYLRLADLRAAVATDLRTRGAKLPELTSYTPTATLPALVVAYKVHGDATRADEIVARNNISHPGFTPGGQELEVLSE